MNFPHLQPAATRKLELKNNARKLKFYKSRDKAVLEDKEPKQPEYFERILFIEHLSNPFGYKKRTYKEEEIIDKLENR